MYYSCVEIEYVAMSFSPDKTDLALKLLTYEFIYTMNSYIFAVKNKWIHLILQCKINEFIYFSLQNKWIHLFVIDEFI